MRRWRRRSLDTDGAPDGGPPLAVGRVAIAATADPLGPVHAALVDLWAAAERTLRHPPEAAWRAEFATAVGEIAANVARHAFDDPAAAAFEFAWSLDRRGVRATFRDAGVPFAGALPGALPAAAGGGDAAALPEGGWGLALARAALDDLSYDRAGGENRWVLSKTLRNHAGSG
jgi:serine/threonine-protein kinase RsbW